MFFSESYYILYVKIMSMKEEYIEHQVRRLAEYEAQCTRCGTCCGADTDPCMSLKLDGAGKYYCDSYNDRLGERYTVSGIKFTCIPIRDVLVYAPPSADCGYAE